MIRCRRVSFSCLTKKYTLIRRIGTRIIRTETVAETPAQTIDYRNGEHRGLEESRRNR